MSVGARGWLVCKRVAVLVGLLVGLDVAVSAWAGEMVRTDSGHLVPPVEGGPSNGETPPMWRTKLPQVVLRDPKMGWRQAGTIDRALSLACRAGRFTQIRPMQFRAMLSDGVLGVAFGHGLNLYDPDHKAKADQIYLFRFAGSTACEVLARKNGDAAAASAPPTTAR